LASAPPLSRRINTGTIPSKTIREAVLHLSRPLRPGMVKMSPLQGSRFEVIPASDEMGIIGAAVNAAQAAK
jgi:hypothetical protein